MQQSAARRTRAPPGGRSLGPREAGTSDQCMDVPQDLASVWCSPFHPRRPFIFPASRVVPQYASPVAHCLVLAGFELSVFPSGLISSPHLEIAIQNPPSGRAHRKGGGGGVLTLSPGLRLQGAESELQSRGALHWLLRADGSRGGRVANPTLAQILPGLGLVAAWDAPRSPRATRCRLRPPR